jgi:hypothetical protein
MAHTLLDHIVFLMSPGGITPVGTYKLGVPTIND